MRWTEHRNLAFDLHGCADVHRFWWCQTTIWCTSVFRGKRSHHTACYASPCSKLTLLLCWLAAPQSWAREAQTRRNFGPNRVQLRDWRPTDAIGLLRDLTCIVPTVAFISAIGWWLKALNLHRKCLARCRLRHLHILPAKPFPGGKLHKDEAESKKCCRDGHCRSRRAQAQSQCLEHKTSFRAPLDLLLICSLMSDHVV